MTEKYYQRDSYCQRLEARIVAKEQKEGRWLLRLDRTIFSPEAGGQPADAGTLNEKPVRELAMAGDDILHICDGDPGTGTAVLAIDFNRRYDHMQQHTAQHLLSQVLVRRLAAATLSFAIGAEHSSIEIDRAEISAAEIRACEDDCWQISRENRQVKIFETNDLSSLQLRKPPKVSDLIRVVEISDFDQSACGGTHVRSSAEIGLVKIIRTDSVRGHIRLYYLAGERALRDYQNKQETLQRLQQLITLPLAEMPAGIESLQREKEEWKKGCLRLQRRELEREIAAGAATAEKLLVRELAGCSAADLRFFASELVRQGKSVLAYCRAPQPYVVVACPQGDLRSIAPRFFELLQGKGGGRPQMIEGRSGDFSRLPEAIALINSLS
jgi:alanyl-tRNA synthetase